MKTYSLKETDITREWYVVDAAGQNLGRLSSQVAAVLRGKHKPTFTPWLDNGDFVIILNADKIAVTGNREAAKMYYNFTGYAGGLKETNLRGLMAKHPTGAVDARKGWPGYDYLMQAEAGYLHLTGEPGTPPARMGLSIIDYMTGMTLAVGLLSALIGVAKTGQGRDLDVSLFDVALHQLSYPGNWYLNEGLRTERLPRSSHPSAVPVQLFRTRMAGYS